MVTENKGENTLKSRLIQLFMSWFYFNAEQYASSKRPRREQDVTFL